MFFLRVITLIAIITVPVLAHTATMSVTADKQVYTEGDVVTVIVSADSSDVAMNAAEGTLTYPSESLTFLSVDHSSSILKHWPNAEPQLVSDGKVTFEGIILSPGFTGAYGELFRASFVAKKEGSVSLNLLSASILANDGKGTEILTQVLGDEFVVQGEVIYTPPPVVEEPIPTPYAPPVDEKPEVIEMNKEVIATTSTSSVVEEIPETYDENEEPPVSLIGNEIEEDERSIEGNTMPWIVLGLFVFLVLTLVIVVIFAFLSFRRKD